MCGGVADQRAAMKWTFDNIADFGGDRSKISIVGHSAGASSVSQHLVRTASWRYFSSAGMLSGAFADGIATPTVEDRNPNWLRFVQQDLPTLSDIALIAYVAARAGYWRTSTARAARVTIRLSSRLTVL